MGVISVAKEHKRHWRRTRKQSSLERESSLDEDDKKRAKGMMRRELQTERQESCYLRRTICCCEKTFKATSPTTTNNRRRTRIKTTLRHDNKSIRTEELRNIYLLLGWLTYIPCQVFPPKRIHEAPKNSLEDTFLWKGEIHAILTGIDGRKMWKDKKVQDFFLVNLLGLEEIRTEIFNIKEHQRRRKEENCLLSIDKYKRGKRRWKLFCCLVDSLVRLTSLST